METRKPAAERWAELDGDATDGPSVDEAFPAGAFQWPDPGEACACELATAQLYWPMTGPAEVR